MNIYIEHEQAESNAKTMRTLSMIYFSIHPKKFELKSVPNIQQTLNEFIKWKYKNKKKCESLIQYK
jgi:hypothetical protein